MKRIPLAVLLSACTVLAQESSPPESADPMAHADAHFQARANSEELKQAVKSYEDVCSNDGTNYEAHWRLARCIYYYGVREPSRDVRQQLFQKGIDAAKKAIALQPRKAEGHFWLGVNYGVFGEAKGVMKSLSLVGPIKTEMNAVLRIDPNCEGGGPDRVLGRLYYRLPWIAGGSKKQSFEYLQKSLKLAPTNTLTKLYLSDTLWSLGQKAESRKQLEEILTLQPDPRWLPEYEVDRKEAQRRLNNIAKGKKPAEEED